MLKYRPNLYSEVPRSTNSSFDDASLPMCPLQPLKMTVQDTTNNLRNKICFKYAKTNLTNTEDEYSQIQNDHVTTGANTKHLLSSLVYCMIDQYHKVNHRVQRITREAFVDLHSWTKYIFDILSSSVDELLVFHREFISFVYQVFFGMLSYFEQIPIENSMDYQWNMTCPITTKNDRLKDALCYLQMTTLLFVLTCGLIIQTVLHIYMRRLSNRNHDPNEHLPALYDNADGGIPEDKNRICRTVQYCHGDLPRMTLVHLKKTSVIRSGRDVICGLNNERDLHTTDQTRSVPSTSASNHESTIGGTEHEIRRPIQK
ncbi:hypothetical protein BSL78_02891 [Apostichopus japonicus]|uniref:Uncharacterized protein n=1 Tax=Stichopus japonicus TaxID=307972 RepID=A0A2G8LJ09_STIJA|nr:hypothetical protein BSL78_02891 [Apostichopus japonicus]